MWREWAPSGNSSTLTSSLACSHSTYSFVLVSTSRWMKMIMIVVVLPAPCTPAIVSDSRAQGSSLGTPSRPDPTQTPWDNSPSRCGAFRCGRSRGCPPCSGSGGWRTPRSPQSCTGHSKPGPRVHSHIGRDDPGASLGSSGGSSSKFGECQVLTSKDFPNHQFGFENLPSLVLHILSYWDALLKFVYVIFLFLTWIFGFWIVPPFFG